MIRRLPLVAWLTGVWVALWADLSLANVLAGFVLACTLVALFRFPQPVGARGVIRPLVAARFAVLFAWKLVEASVIVAWEVITPRNRIHEAIIAVPIRSATDTLAAIVANFITLTPGTLTLEYERTPSVLYVHVLHLRSIEAVRRDVQSLERIAVRAFGSAEAVRALANGPGIRTRSARAEGEDR